MQPVERDQIRGIKTSCAWVMRWGCAATAVLFFLGLITATASFGAEESKGKTAQQAQETSQGSKKVLEDEFLKLGSEKGIGGKEWMKFERQQIKFQIEQFIPPLLQPAFVGDAFVLPPNAYRVGIAWRYTKITGDNFFRDGDPNRAVFGNFEIERNFIDFDFFYGFDLNVKYLHSFTVRLNIPYLNTTSNGFIHPGGVQFIDIFNDVGSQNIGDIGLFLKKKLIDQGIFPVGIAMVFGVHFPTGSNDEKFGSDGKTLARRPDPDGDGVQPSFQQIQAARADSPKCFFANFNSANPGLCTSPAFSAPASVLESSGRILTPFPFNNGVFGRFSDDGRIPAVLQPGTGEFSFTLGLFFTRQFHPTDFPSLAGFPGRGALHVGGFYKIIQESDGIDPGDKATMFATFVKPIYKDYLAADLTFITFYTQEDKYKGKIPEPEIVVKNGVRTFEFNLVDRPPFAKGYSSYIAPSLIFSPDPQIRILVSGLFRVIEPELGPAPEIIFRIGLQATF